MENTNHLCIDRNIQPKCYCWYCQLKLDYVCTSLQCGHCFLLKSGPILHQIILQIWIFLAGVRPLFQLLWAVFHWIFLLNPVELPEEPHQELVNLLHVLDLIVNQRKIHLNQK